MAFDKGVLDATKYVLTYYPNSRNDDGLLISKVMEKINPSIKGLKFNFVLENINALGLPSFETITRARRKLQEKFPRYKADEKIKNARDELEKEFREFARS